MNDRVPHIVILGGGFGGLDAARALAGAPVRVTLLDRHNYHLFQPLLYQVATASLSPGDIASPIRWVLRRQKNVTVLLANVRDVDVAAKRVILDDGRVETAISYDFLIVATGAAHSYFGRDEWAERAPALKTLDDALEIRRRVLMAFEAAEREPSADAQRRLLTFVIVGGGPTGAELAGALAEIARQSLRQDFRNIRPESARIVLLEGAPHLLNAFPAAASRSRAPVARPPGRRRPPQHRRHRRRRRRRQVSTRRITRSACPRRRSSGPRAWRHRRLRRRSVRRSIAPAACAPSRRSPFPAIRRSSSPATSAR